MILPISFLRWLLLLALACRSHTWRIVRNTIASSLLTFSLTNLAVATDGVQYYGLKDGSLLTCKTKANCLSTSSVKSLERFSPPWLYDGDVESVYNNLLKVLQNDQLFKVVDTIPSNYIRAEAKSAVPIGGTDDIEFLFNDKDKIITYRSNSREVVAAGPEILGDGGSHKNRLESIKRKINLKSSDQNEEMEEYMQEFETKYNFIQKLQMASQPNDINFLDNKPYVNE